MIRHNKAIVLLAILLASFISHAQPVMMGMMNSSSYHPRAVRYIGGDTTVTVLDSFSLGHGYPATAMTEGPDGSLYGVVGAIDSAQYGAIISYDYIHNHFKILAKFDAVGLGFSPVGKLCLGADGLLYGMTNNGGWFAGGLMYSFDINTDSISVLGNFPANARPQGSVIQAGSGKLYGLTYGDGANNGGTISQYQIPNVNGIHSVWDLPNRSHPTGSLIELGADTFYGVASGNLLFRYTFGGYYYQPIYGGGGALTGDLVLASNGLLYGTATSGGVTGYGYLFSYDVYSGVCDTLYNFPGIGYAGKMVQASDGNLYGNTTTGGNGRGTLFKYNIGTATYTREVILNDTTGYFYSDEAFVEYKPVSHHITTQPLSQVVCLNDSVVFTAFDSSTFSTSAQWHVSADSGRTYTVVPNNISSTYKFRVTAAVNGYMYRVIFSSGDTSTPATLSVAYPVTYHQSPSICYGTVISVGGITHSVAGLYTDTLFGASVLGCDSIVISDLSIWPLDTFSQNQRLCYGASYTINGHVYYNAGMYVDTLTGMSAHGCDSIVTTHLAFWSLDTVSQQQQICFGQILSVNGHHYNATGTYVDTFTGMGIHGCDSIVTTHLSVWNIDTASQQVKVCYGQSYVINGHTYVSGGIYSDTLRAMGIHGCDSIVTTYLTILDSVHAYFSLQASSTPHLWYIVNQCSGTSSLTYSWSWGDSTANSTTDTPSHTYAAVGYYTVCVQITDSEGCTAHYCDSSVYLYKDRSGQVVQLRVVSQLPNDIKDVDAIDVRITPNPTQGLFTLSSDLSGMIRIRVINVLGIVMKEYNMTSQKLVADIRDLANGVYLLQIESEDKRFNKAARLIKE